jgi:hypothetical protein
MNGFIRVFGALAFALATPVWAQPPAAAPSDQADCEFHVWPADALMSVYYGWFHGSTVNGQIRGRPGYPAVPPDPIDTATQALILESIHPQLLLNHTAHRLVVHREALSSRAIRGATGRLSDSASPCYAELIVDDVVLQQGVAGSSLGVLFHYRDFGPGAAPQASFTTWAQADLSTFPPRRPDQLADAIREIREAYRQDIRQFAAMAMRPRRRH